LKHETTLRGKAFIENAAKRQLSAANRLFAIKAGNYKALRSLDFS